MSDGQPQEQRTVTYAEIQALSRESEALQQQRAVFEQNYTLMSHTVTDLENSIRALKEIKTREKGEVVLMPLGPQMMIETTISNQDTVFLLLGKKISRKVNFETANESLVKRIANAKKALESLRNQIYKLDEMINQRENFLRSIVPVQS